MAKRGAKGTLTEAANFLANEAEQLAILALLVAINSENLAALQAAARGYWDKARRGWVRQLSLFGGEVRYDKQKRAITGHAESGVLSGGWKAYRCLEAADITLREYRRARPRLVFSALNYSSKELKTRQKYEGAGSVPAKPWRNWPQRYVPVEGGAGYVVPAAAAIRGLKAAKIKDLDKELPLAYARINFKRLTREGRRIGTIRKKRAKIQTALRRAIENAV